MRLLASALLVTGLLSNVALANGPRFFCESLDGVKAVRVAPGPWGKMQANVYHQGSLYKSLKCEMNVAGMLYSCQDDAVPPARFTLQYDRVNGRYDGTRDVRDLVCRYLGETAE